MDESVKEDPVQPLSKQTLWTKRNMIILVGFSCSNFALGCTFSLPAPFFPREAQAKGATYTQYGLVFGVFQLVYLIMSPIWGKLMPYLIPKFMLVTGLFVSGSCSILFGLLDLSPPGVPFIALAFCVRIVEALGATAYSTPCYGLVPALFPEHVATVLSFIESMFGFGLIAGPTIGGALYQVGGYKLPFLVLGGVLILSTILTAFTMENRDMSAGKTGGMLEMLSSFPLIMHMIVFGSAFICIGFNDATLEPHLRQFNLTPAALGGVFIITGGIYAFFAPFYGRLIDKGVNPVTLCIFGGVLCFLAYLIIGPVPFLPFKTSFPVIIVALVMLGFGLGINCLSAFMAGMKDVMRRGFAENVSTFALYSGITMAVNSAGAFIGPSMGGLLLDHVGYEKGTIVLVVLQGVLIIMTLTFRIKQSTVSKQPELVGDSHSSNSTYVKEFADEESPLIDPGSKT